MQNLISNFRFEDPWLLLLLLLVPVYLFYSIKRSKQKFVSLKISSLSAFKSTSSLKVRLMRMLIWLRLLAVVMLIIAIARPQSDFSNDKLDSLGIDIVLALDVSSSMYAVDYPPNRMEVAKEAAIEFIDSRPNDRIGLVVFAGEAFTQCPSTLDHEMLKNQVRSADNWYLKAGTAIGDGLFLALNRLADTNNVQTKVIILLTDGVRIGGKYSPVDAAKAAEQLNVRVYTIGIGNASDQPIPVVDKNKRIIFNLDPNISFDEPMMKEIAAITGGTYFKATSKENLIEIYRQIDQIEKQKFEVTAQKRYDDHFFIFALIALLAIVIEIILTNTIFRSLT